MQQDFTTAENAEKIKHSIRMIEKRIEANKQILGQSIIAAQNASENNNKKGDNNNCAHSAIEDCKAAIRKLEFIQVHSRKINQDTIQQLIQRYNEMAIAQIKNTILTAEPIS